MRIGIIGYGGRASDMFDKLSRVRPEAELVAITDPRVEEIKRHLPELGVDAKDVAFYEDAGQMLDSQELDGVMIGTRCSLHTRMAILVLARNIPLFLEKPVATSMADLMALRDAGVGKGDRVVVSFPLRVTPLVQMAKEITDSGKIGTVEHVQAWNNPSYGWHYFQTWYRDENETQGLFLQKATHDFDYINYLVGQKPMTVCAMTSKRVFKGDRPAGLRCSDCGEWEECLESPYHMHYTKQAEDRVKPNERLCCFAVDTGNEDSGSAIIRYENGMHAAYTQDFIARNSAGKRGATLIGYKGSIQFDWYTEELNVFMHHTPRVETYKISSESGHGGGDTVLVDSFAKVIRGESESVAPLDAGLMSALMCLRAKESAAANTFQDICYPAS